MNNVIHRSRGLYSHLLLSSSLRTMDTLPLELVIDILGYLDHYDLLSLSLTSRTFRALVKHHFLFDILHLDGAEGMPVYHQRGGPFGQFVSARRERTVKLSELDSAVEEVIGMGIASFVRTFKFSPARYVKSKFLSHTHQLCYGSWAFYVEIIVPILTSSQTSG